MRSDLTLFLGGDKYEWYGLCSAYGNNEWRNSVGLESMEVKGELV